MLSPLVLFASLAFLQQVPAAAPAAPPAQTPPPAQGEVTTLPPVNANSRQVADTTQICRTEAVTGSRFGRRVCRSAIQTEEDRAASREMLRQMQGSRMPDGG